MSTLSIFIDESGDLGCNFENQNTTRYFIIGALVCKNIDSYKHIQKSVERTIKNKINYKKNQKKNKTLELKSFDTPLHIKKYFLKQCLKNNDWDLYFCIFDKVDYVKNFGSLKSSTDKKNVYNLIADALVKNINYSTNEINLYLDKHKSAEDEKNFNEIVEASLKDKIIANCSEGNYKIKCRHVDSRLNKGIQAIDYFCGGVYSKNNNKKLNSTWYNLFSEKIIFELHGVPSGPLRRIREMV